MQHWRNKKTTFGRWCDVRMKAGVLPQPMQIGLYNTKAEGLRAETRAIEDYR